MFYVKIGRDWYVWNVGRMYGILALNHPVSLQPEWMWLWVRLLAGWLATYLDSTRIGKLILHSALGVFRISSKCAGSHRPQSSLHNDISALRLGNFRLYVKRGSQMSSMDSWLNLITTLSSPVSGATEPASYQAVPSQERDGLDTTARSSPWLCSTVSLNWK